MGKGAGRSFLAWTKLRLLERCFEENIDIIVANPIMITVTLGSTSFRLHDKTLQKLKLFISNRFLVICSSSCFCNWRSKLLTVPASAPCLQKQDKLYIYIVQICLGVFSFILFLQSAQFNHVQDNKLTNQLEWSWKIIKTAGMNSGKMIKNHTIPLLIASGVLRTTK